MKKDKPCAPTKLFLDQPLEKEIDDMRMPDEERVWDKSSLTFEKAEKEGKVFGSFPSFIQIPLTEFLDVLFTIYLTLTLTPKHLTNL